MTDPYETLGLSRQAGDEEIRARYLELVREFPPDRAAERFAAVRAAYEQLRDPAVRMQSLLFEAGGEESIPAMVADIRRRLRRAAADEDVIAPGQALTCLESHDCTYDLRQFNYGLPAVPQAGAGSFSGMATAASGTCASRS